MDRLTLYMGVGYLSTSKPVREVVLPEGSVVSSLVAVNPHNEVMSVSVKREEDVVTKNDTKYTGRVKEYTSKYASIYDTRLRIVANYDEIEKGRYIVSSALDFRLSVPINKLSWKCVAFCTLTDSILTCRFTGVISNDTESTIVADVVLVSGASRASEKSSAAFMSRALESSSPVVEKDIEEHKAYAVGEVSIDEITTMELTFFEVESFLFYRHRVGTYDVSFGYSFVAPSFVPSCTATLFTEDLGSVIGTGNMIESREGEEVEIVAGNTTKIRCVSRLESGDLSDRMVVRVRGEEYPFSLVVTHYIGNRAIMRIIPDNDRVSVKEGMLRIPLAIYEDSEDVITVEYRQ